MNCIAPGAADADMLRLNVSEEAKTPVAGMPTMGRIAAPADIGRALMMLCDEDAGWITGQIIRAHGWPTGCEPEQEVFYD